MESRLTFGAELRRRRQLAGLSLTQLALSTHYSKGYLSKVESSGRSVNPTLARLCDAAVGANGALVALATEAPAADGPGDPEADPDADNWLLRLAPDGAAHFQHSDGTGATMFGPSPGAAGFPADPAVLSTLFRARFDQARSLGQIVPPAYVLPMLIAETHLVRGLATHSEDRAPAADLWRLAAQFAELTGWMIQDTGDDQQAMWWTAFAVRLAGRGNDGSMQPFALLRRADVAMYADDGRTMIDLAAQAYAHPSATVRVRGLAAQREAQGYALLGDARACFAALGHSGELLQQAEQQAAALVLGSTRTPDLTTMVRGWCMYELGRPAAAAELLEAGIAAFTAASARARVRFGLRTALAHATAGEPDRACDIMERLFGDLSLVDSTMARHDIRLIHRELRRQGGSGRVRDVLPAIADLLRGPASA